MDDILDDVSDLQFGIDEETYIEKVDIENPMVFPPENELSRVMVIPVSDTCPFPNLPFSLFVEKGMNMDDVSEAIKTHAPVVFLFRDPKESNLKTLKGCSKVGVIGRVIRHIPLPDDNEPGQILCLGGPRVKVTKFNVGGGKRSATLSYFKMPFPEENLENEVIIDRIKGLKDEIQSIMNPDYRTPEAEEMPKDILTYLYLISFQLPVNPQLKNELLCQPTFRPYTMKLLEILNNLLEISKLRKSIEDQTHREIDKEQREMFLRHQVDLIQNQLGEESNSDISKLKKRAAEKKWNEETGDHFDHELQKLSRFNYSSPDYGIQYTYLDTFLNLPWNEYSHKDYSLDRIEEVLNRDHFGLERVKERILEQMAVAMLRDDNKAPILCFVGPPGVGKTSLGKSIAEAMGREYARVSFGGMHDEAEIRGHRRTYIGAMPGRIIAALAKKKTSDPVIVLDEVDKIGKDFKGDPSTALLEVLDPEQNSKFHDNYIGADYDLSNVMFIATANTLETLSAPLRDRMEIISIPGYITAEKVEIAGRHLIPKALRENGFAEKEIDFTPEALTYITDYYTRESGVRKLEKTISKILRKIAVRKVRGEEYPPVVTKEIAGELLGKEEFNPEMYENNDYIGVVTGLAWTSVGGEILFIESSLTPGKGKLTLTGNLGDVMKESAAIAHQYLRAHSSNLGLSIEDFNEKDVHIHVPEGAIPKDGPSAGITMATSLASSFTGKKVKSNLAMTGEITLRGKVLPVGGIKEKIIAAKRAGITEIILSEENRKDIAEINARYLEGLSFVFVRDVDDVLAHALID